MTDLHARDQEWMAHVVGLARRSPALPYAAVLVSDAGQILAEALNETETRGPVWHAELSALDQAARRPAPDWNAVTLYTTAEPCPMCMGAILFAGVGRVVFGTSIATLADRGWWQVRLAASEINRAAGSPAMLVGGVRAVETDALFSVREPGRSTATVAKRSPGGTGTGGGEGAPNVRTTLLHHRGDTRPPWKRKRPNKDSTPLSPKEKDEARARARAAGRPYPNLVDNMAVARQRAGKESAARKAKKAKQ